MALDERYMRQVLFWGEEKQQLLERATVLVAGIGGLGATVSQLLARAGIGKLYLVDDGLVDWPDLHRQLLYTEADIGQSKLDVARERLLQINSTVKIELLRARIDRSFEPPEEIIFVADCLDNYSSRFDLAACLTSGTLLVHGGIDKEQGQVLTLRIGDSQPLAEIFSGALQPTGKIPVTGDGVIIIAGLMVNELFSVIFGQPKLLNRCMVVGLGDFHLSFLDV